MTKTTTRWILLVILTGIVVIVSLLNPSGKSQLNAFTGRDQRIELSPGDEVQLGLQLAPQLGMHYNGLSGDLHARKTLRTLGQKLVRSAHVDSSEYKFDFHILADTVISQVFALPGGQIFITTKFLQQLQTDDQRAAVISHAIGHVLGRHVTEHLPDELAQKKTATSVGNDPQQVAEYVQELSEISFSTAEEKEADAFAVKCMRAAGYDPNAFLQITFPDFRARHSLYADSPEKIAGLKK